MQGPLLPYGNFYFGFKNNLQATGFLWYPKNIQNLITALQGVNQQLRLQYGSRITVTGRFGKYYFVCWANIILYIWQILFCMFGKYYFVCWANINIILYVGQILFCMLGKYIFLFFLYICPI